MARFRRALRVDKAPWCPAWMLPGLGVLFGVAGAPRCPVAAASAVGAYAWWRRDAWGPAPLREELKGRWDALHEWARSPLPPGVPEAQCRRLERARTHIREAAHARFWGHAPDAWPGLARALYVAAWMRRHGAAMLRELACRSRTRRWAPGQGDEWRLLAAAPNYTAAHHVLRLLLGGLPGGARWRGSGDRAPRRCQVCEAPAAWAWTTPRDGEGGPPGARPARGPGGGTVAGRPGAATGSPRSCGRRR